MEFVCCITYFIPDFLGKVGSDEHIDHHTNDIVRDGDERAGRQGRVDLHPVERHWDQSSEDTGKDHDGKEAQRDRCSDALVAQQEEVANEYDQADRTGINKRDDRFLQDLG